MGKLGAHVGGSWEPARPSGIREEMVPNALLLRMWNYAVDPRKDLQKKTERSFHGRIGADVSRFTSWCWYQNGF